MTKYFYDIETYPNLFQVTFKDVFTRLIITFKLTKNSSDIKELQEFLNQNNVCLIGFNNSRYDDRILQFIEYKKYDVSNEELYYLSQAIIENNVQTGFKAVFNDFQENISPFVKSFDSIDLYKFYRNKPLKYLALGLNMDKIQELPYDPHKELTEDEIANIEAYCENDVNITEAVYKECLPKIEAREVLNEKYADIKTALGYKKDFRTLSDSTLAADISALNYCSRNNINFWDFTRVLKKPDYDTLALKDLIFGSIEFETKTLQKLLRTLKEKTIHFKPETISDGKNSFETLIPVSNDEVKEEVIINGKTYQIGLGGLHSTVKNKIYEGNIIDVDVSSYYPNLIINKRIKPYFLNDFWIDNYDELIKQRIKAKKNGDKKTADALKIVINSFYGNYRYPNFYAYDPKTAYTVTLNGQLYLLMLIEALEFAGHEVISANTDGITYIKNSESDDTAVLLEWQKNTGLELEKTFYTNFIEKDVNNYSALKKDGGIKRKGIFAPPSAGSGLKAGIITEAAENYIYNKIPVSETAANCSDIRQFLYSHETGKQFETIYNGSKIQSINRYFVSDSEKAHYLQKKDKNGKLTYIDAHNKVITANDLTDKTLINLVNKKYYIKETEQLLNELLAAERAKELQESNIQAVNELQKQGLKLVPKTYKDNIKGIKLNNLPDNFDFSIYLTIAAATGNGIIAIDVDYPELLPNKLKETLESCGALKSCVQEGGRCKYFFKNAPSVIKQRNYLKQYGFEILCGKPANIAGAYNYKDNYKYEGCIIDIPDDITTILKRIQSIEKPVSKSERKAAAINPDETNDILEFIRDALNKRSIEFEEKQPESDYQKEICSEYAPIIFHFRCPFEDEHTGRGSSDVILCLNEYGQIFVKCWHESCSDSISAFKKELNQELKAFLKEFRKNNPALETAAQDDEEREFIQNIKPLEVLDICLADFYKILSETKDKTITLINAPTGCGKTYTSIKYVIECVKSGEKAVIICSTIEEVKRTAGIIKGYNYEDFSLAVSGLDTEPDKFKSIIITTYAYIASKGDSGTSYKIASKILTDRIVICDEIQMIETYSNKIIPLCGRYQIEENSLKLIHQCLHTSRKGKCENCYRIIEARIDTKILEYSLYNNMPYVDKYRQQVQNPPADDIFEPSFYNDISINTLKTQRIKPDKKLFKNFPFFIDYISNFEDLELRIQYPYVQNGDEKEFLTKENVIKLCECEKPSKITYPKYACGIPMLHCKSKMFYENIFSYSKKIIAMSATIPAAVQTDFQKFAELSKFEIQKYNIETAAVKFNITMLKIERKLSHSDIGCIINSAGASIFLVEASLYDAKLQYDELTKDSRLASKIIFFKQGDYTNIYENLQGEAKTENNSGKIILTYANSAICRAKDMPDINLVIIDCAQFLPLLALDYKSENVDKLEMRDIQAENISGKLHQIIGRVFRSRLKYAPDTIQIDGRRIILLLHNLPYELQDFKPNQNICSTYKEYTNEHITGLLDKERKNCIAASIQEIFNDEIVRNKALEQKYKVMIKAIEKGVSKLNRRSEYDLLDERDRDVLKFLKRVENSYKEILSYFEIRYKYTPEMRCENE